jgi:hypothetical protein
MGPWGDAIMHELLPAVEGAYRGIGEGGLAMGGAVVYTPLIIFHSFFHKT